MQIKKISVLLALLCTLGATSLPAHAQNLPVSQLSGSITPRMSYVSQSYSLLSFSGNTATVDVYIERTPYGGKIVATSKLQCDGKTVKSWTTTETSSFYAEIFEDYTVSKHGTYQVVTSYTVYAADGKSSEYMVDKSKTVVY